jgi:carbamoyltransferase
MKVVGLYNWHDGGYAVLNDGVVEEHTEFERYTRLKESGGDSLQLFCERYLKKMHTPESFKKEVLGEYDFAAPMPSWSLSKGSGKTYDTHDFLPEDNVHYFSHHLCHAANSYYSSPFKDAISISVDNAGMLNDNMGLSWSTNACNENRIYPVAAMPSEKFSLGDLWGRMTRWVFKLSSGFPRGHQAGSVMAMAALGDSDKYYEDLKRMMTVDHRLAVMSPPGAKRGVYVPPDEEVVHPYLNKWRLIAEDEQEKFNIAASLQRVTEDFFVEIVRETVFHLQSQGFDTKNVCFSGGVSLNSVAMGKLVKKFPDLNFFIPPVPYDGGLSIGAAQLLYHSVQGNPKVYDEQVALPYLGETYSNDDECEALGGHDLNVEESSIEEVAKLLNEGSIISVFSGRSESGRRALGNRSILANPALPEMKQMINDKVKHRQWYRPFAPSVLDEHGNDWFEDYFFSPYMGFVFQIKSEKRGLAPAIEHFDGSARIQSVTKDTNPWYHNLISEFHKLSGVPMVLNTSFNDREPIVETPSDAINCFLGTNIDYLYFEKSGLLVSKK